MKESYGKILYKAYDILGFTEAEKVTAREAFKKKFYSDLLLALKDGLSSESRDWVELNMKSGSEDREMMKKIVSEIDTVYSRDEVLARSNEIFSRIFGKYVDFMVSKIDEERGSRLKEIKVGLDF